MISSFIFLKERGYVVNKNRSTGQAGKVSPKATSEAELERDFLAGKIDSVFL
jgi:hypothetical protein